MSLIHWDPFAEIREIQEAVNKLFDDSLSKRKGNKKELGFWEPAIDVIETKDDYRIKAEFPGIPKEDIEISISGDVLTIKGEKKKDEEIKDANYYRRERVYGLYQRQLVLPKDVDTEKIKANYKDGVLELIIPKGEESKPKKIKIE